MFYDVYGNLNMVENFTDIKSNPKKRILISRILGNDLSALHNKDQTYNNLKFTLENESDFNELTDKYEIKYLYVLNRIYSKEKKKKIIDLLKKHNKDYVDIKFNIIEFENCFDKSNLHIFKKDIILEDEYNKDEILLRQYLKKFNLYIINNNGSRNFCLKFGKKNNYDWNFVLDSNSYFTDKLFLDIINNIKNNSRYILMDQLRLAENKLKNDDLLKENIHSELMKLPRREPQIAFHIDSKFEFNDKIPYGSAPKQEMINLIRGPEHSNNRDAYLHYKIKQREKTDEKHQNLSAIIRLDPDNPKNEVVSNRLNRNLGLYELINHIKDDLKISVEEI